MAGTLYLVGTPIGNLGDVSPRALETLESADFIAAEDTRVTLKMLNHFGIKKQLVCYFEHNRAEMGEKLLARLLAGESCALVTDAGTPCISDPGCETVRECAALGIPVIPVPGCCAGIAAVSVSGFDAREFTFYGFLPREKKDLKEKLREIARGAKVAVAHESPFRITDLTEAVAETLPQAKLAVCCDLTKLHEKTLYGTPEEVLSALRANEKTEKGEYCVVMDLHGVPAEEKEPEAAEWPMEARIIEEMKKGLGLREAQEALIARGEKKNAVKQAAVTLKRMFNI